MQWNCYKLGLTNESVATDEAGPHFPAVVHLMNYPEEWKRELPGGVFATGPKRYMFILLQNQQTFA